jgi:ADP-dependent NAD(P)H-hydrate dehydratase
LLQNPEAMGTEDSRTGSQRASVAVLLTEAVLRGWPLPLPEGESDKEARGRVLVIAGSREMPGAAVLAGTAALHAGAGKLRIATAASVAQSLALAIPEARVIGLPETKGGGLHVSGVEQLSDWEADAVLLGPGLLEEDESCRFAEALLRQFRECPVVLDAFAMSVVSAGPCLESPVLLTPHAGELAHLTGMKKGAVLERPCETALEWAARWNAVVALKGAKTWIASPEGRSWLHVGGNTGLGTCGSGDTLAGIIVGLAARGASLEQAAAWGVALHARAGEALSERQGGLGYLARDLSAELPRLMRLLGR